MTKKIAPDWELELKKIELHGYGSVALMCDEYQTSWQIARLGNKFVFFYFVDGVHRGEFITAESKIGQKFGKPKYHILSQKMYQLLLKCEGKKVAEFEKKKAASTVLLYRSFHPSAASVIRTLRRTCEVVKLIL
jgi:hypothetical protein